MKRSAHAMGRRPARRGDHPRRRSAAVTLELILMLPAWIILMLAVVEFGLILVNRQQVALASRVGAEEASRTPGLSLISGDPVPANVLRVIDQQLASSCIARCKVVLEHNVDPPVSGSSSPILSSSSLFPVGPIGPSVVLTQTILTSGGCDCPPPLAPLPPSGQAVRVTIFVPVTELAPNLLSVFGLDLSDRFIYHATTFRYEL